MESPPTQRHAEPAGQLVRASEHVALGAQLAEPQRDPFRGGLCEAAEVRWIKRGHNVGETQLPATIEAL